MTGLKSMLKVLLIALFVCVLTDSAKANCFPECGDGYTCVASPNEDGTDSVYKCVKRQSGNDKKDDKKGLGGNGEVAANFCDGSLGIFSDLVRTGQTIFNRLRDLIYVVAGFGIIAVAVGGFFGNLNWKWLGAIVISLVVIATAGELIVLMTGCESYSATLITNTLSNPTPMSTSEYNESFTLSGAEGRGAAGSNEAVDTSEVLP